MQMMNGSIPAGVVGLGVSINLVDFLRSPTATTHFVFHEKGKLGVSVGRKVMELFFWIDCQTAEQLKRSSDLERAWFGSISTMHCMRRKNTS